MLENEEFANMMGEAVDNILFSSNYEVESTSIRIYVSKSEEKLKGVLLKDIDRQDIEKVFENDVVYEDEVFKEIENQYGESNYGKEKNFNIGNSSGCRSCSIFLGKRCLQ